MSNLFGPKEYPPNVGSVLSDPAPALSAGLDANANDITDVGNLQVTTINGSSVIDSEVTAPADTELLIYSTADAEFKNLNINSLTVDATPDKTADYVITWDASAGKHKKVLISVLLAL